MNFLTNILEEIKWKAQDFFWSIQDKLQLNKIEDNLYSDEDIEAKPKKKKAKKKSKK